MSTIFLKIIRFTRYFVIGVAFIAASTYGWWPSVPPRFNQSATISPANVNHIIRYLSEDIGPRNYINYDHLKKASEFITQMFTSLILKKLPLLSRD
ncbi:MAG: hypothetical protein HQL24_08830 [Candidatus Omnitrophica bacterium]|nr:hypothetical protein [Candidatus Omnitrophota bacterium]